MIDREWHILEKPEYWDEGPCFDNKGNLPLPEVPDGKTASA